MLSMRFCNINISMCMGANLKSSRITPILHPSPDQTPGNIQQVVEIVGDRFDTRGIWDIHVRILLNELFFSDLHWQSENPR